MALEVTGGVIRDGSGNEETLADLSEGRAKAWAQLSNNANADVSFNVGSTTDAGTGVTDISFSNAFSTADKVEIGSVSIGAGVTRVVAFSDGRKTTTTARSNVYDGADSGTESGVVDTMVSFHGTLA